ncbi:glycosyltransferase [Synoicihabitans lomoniglobus]|uniref:Glycosyltransferase n=1 Tax=Synoicihabitans lomoniglobus TaxID=2909285 RepID=A0AAF0CSS4_9BACT|nr:glycosyltransferase [Opitutaceae bacterium LMO-M01]WED67385.1 glycosyltransferase [Opitutaceae bacterium LMO-M01]
MFENDFCRYFIDEPIDWDLTQEIVDIRGWVLTKSGEEIYDLRARLDGTDFYGIMGLDRPDIRDFFSAGAPGLKSGFRVNVRPWHGAQTLTLEGMMRDGNWVEFFSTPVTTSGVDLPPARPKPFVRSEVLDESLFYLYRHFHSEPGPALRAEARRVLAEISINQTEMLPENDLIGYLDLPNFWVNAHYEKFRVSGWAFSKNQEISRLHATIGCVDENRLVWGKERDDVLHHNPHYPQALKSAFYGLVDIRPESISPACLKIFVDYPDMPRQLLRSKRLFVNKLDENSGPIPYYSHVQFFRVVTAFVREILRHGYELESWSDFRKSVFRTRAKLAEKMIKGGKKTNTPPPPTPWERKEPYDLWCHHNRLTPRLLKFLEAEAKPISTAGPKISILVPTYNTPVRFLDELIDAVKAQIYTNWELCFADDNSPQKHVAKKLAAAAASDSRIKFVVRPENGHISAATNSALALATGEYVSFLDHDDLLPADALLHVVESIATHPTVDFLYTDEDKIDASGRHYDPQFKGDWNPDMAITHNYTHHLRTIRRSIVEKVGGLRIGYEGAQDIDLILRCVEHIDDTNIVHVPFVCYHWRAHDESTAQRGDQKGYLFDAARRAIIDAVERRGLRAEVMLPPVMEENALCLHQLKWNSELLAENPVSIIIPTRDQATILQTCVDSLDRTVNWAHVKLIVVDDGSTATDATALLASIESRHDRPWRVLRPARDGNAFNYSRLVNAGTLAADTPLVLHLNNDVEAIEPGWLEDMVGWTTVNGVGVVGARLIHRDESLNHAGIWVGPNGGLAHCVFVGLPKDDFGYLFLPHAARNTTAVTGACLLTRKDLYEQLNGFDETQFQVAYNDVDFCMRAAAAGYRTVYTPQATLIHVGSASRGISYTETEHLAFVQKYPGFRDPHFSESVEYANPSFRINAYDHRFASRQLKLRVGIISHNLNLEGAPLFIVEYARHLKNVAGWDVKVFAPMEGPLRENFAETGLDVEIIDITATTNAQTTAEFARGIDQLAKLTCWQNCDLLVGNTMLSYWVVPLAQKLGLPSSLYIHESNTPRRFFAEHRLATDEVIPLIEKAMSEATRVNFIARATRRIFADLNRFDNFRLIDSWIDIERIENYIDSTDRGALRRELGIPENATVVVNVGSVCQRKGQHIFIRAIDHLHKKHGAELEAHGPLLYVMVGAREGLYLETIENDIELMGLTNTRLIYETQDVYAWYRVADMFCCTSFEESFPRVLLEAASFKLPIVSTDVDGITEMLTRNDEAYLIKAGDYHVLAATLKQALDRHYAGDSKMVSMAFSRISRFYDSRISLPHHVELARETYFG